MTEGDGVPFQWCGACRQSWPTWREFVCDPEVRLLGMQGALTSPDFNALVFEHRCGSSISILTPRLRHLLPPPSPDEPRERLFGSDQCRGHCRYLCDFAACEAPCSNARDRRLILFLEAMKRAFPEGDSRR